MLLIFCPAVNLSGVISQLFLSLLSHCHYTKSTSLPPDDTPLDALSVAPLISGALFLQISSAYGQRPQNAHPFISPVRTGCCPPQNISFPSHNIWIRCGSKQCFGIRMQRIFQKDFLHLLLQQVCQDTSLQFCLK